VAAHVKLALLIRRGRVEQAREGLEERALPGAGRT
jgi:hypothetical protein